MKCLYSLLFVGLVVFLLSGCADEGEHAAGKVKTSQTPAKKAKPAKAATKKSGDEGGPETTPSRKPSGLIPGDPEAVQALEKLAARVDTDKDGFVVRVNCIGATIDDSALSHLTGLHRLSKLDLNGTGVSDEGLKTVGSITTLQHLDLRGCKISNAGIAHLVKLTGLVALRLNGQNGATTVDDTGLAALADLTKLRVLMLDQLWVSEDGIAKLKKLKNLEELYLAKTLAGDEVLALLKQFPKLKKLRASGNQVTNAGLVHLTVLKDLEFLDLSEDSQISDEGLAHVGQLTNLKDLNLWRVAITNEGVQHLAGLVNMERLNLDNTQLTDAGLPYIEGMKKLTFLHLGSTAVSNEGLKHLKGLSALKDVHVTRTAVTETGVAELNKSLPDAEIQLIHADDR